MAANVHKTADLGQCDVPVGFYDHLQRFQVADHLMASRMREHPTRRRWDRDRRMSQATFQKTIKKICQQDANFLCPNLPA